MNKKLKQTINGLPKPLKKLYLLSDKCITAMIKKGYSFEESEKMVLDVLKESLPYMESGMFSEVEATLKMTFLDMSTEDAAKDLIKDLLK